MLDYILGNLWEIFRGERNSCVECDKKINGADKVFREMENSGRKVLQIVRTGFGKLRSFTGIGSVLMRQNIK